MKNKSKILSVAAAIMLCLTSIAQTPQAFKYQTVVRNAAGEIIQNQNVSFLFRIHDSSASGTVIYSERHSVTTNQFGLVNLEIGIGIPVYGTFSTIEWGTNSKFLEVGFDPAGGNSYTSMGTTQLLSVPYSLYSENTANADDDWEIDGDDMYSEVSGNVGIGTSTPGATLDVGGHIWQTGTGHSVFIGEGAGENDDLSDNFNTFVGYNSGNTNTTGSRNSANGVSSLYANTSGSYNTSNGFRTLNNNTIGECNTANGFRALNDNTEGDNNTAIGNQTLYKNTTAYSNVGVGAKSLFNNTDRSNLVAIGDSSLYNNGIGATISYEATANTALGSKSLFSNTIGAQNTAAGIKSLYYNTEGNSNTAYGAMSLYSNTTGGWNTANGTNSLSSNTEGSNNTANGESSLGFNTTGANNTASGSNSLGFNTTGANNTASGSNSLASNTEGDCNTANGNSTLFFNSTGHSNVGVGTNALFYNTEKSNLVAIGDSALYNNGTDATTVYHAIKNSAFGSKALFSNTTGFNNIASGFESLYSNTTGFRNTANGANTLYSNTTGYRNTANGNFVLYSNTEGNDNTACGYASLKENTTGFSNVAVGVSSLHNNTYRSNIVAIGDSALYNNGSGASLSYHSIENTAVGSKSLFSNTIGYYNTAFGFNSLFSNISGSHNAAYGHKSLGENTIGYCNTGIGMNANYNNLEGNNNTTIGFQAGAGSVLHSKSGNVFLGYRAGCFEYGDNKLYIENSDSDIPLIYGEFDNKLLRINGTLDINNEYQFPLSDGANGQFFTTDGNGILSWTNVSEVNEINDLTDAKTGGSSVFLGLGAGDYDDGTDNTNVAIGIDAMKNNTVGYNNTATGYHSLTLNVFGFDNVAYGCESLGKNTSGYGNTGIGFQANNHNQEGNYNTIVGFQAGAGQSSHNKSRNVFLGYQAGYNEYGNNKLYIENSNSPIPLIYGEFDNNLLRINGTLDINNAYQFPTIDGSNGQIITTDGSGTLSWTNDMGATDIDGLVDAKTYGNSIFIGFGAGSNDYGTNNMNVAIGYFALSTNESGAGNTASGYNSLSGNNGDYNTASGYYSLSSNTTGDKNTASGSHSLDNNTTGNDNTASGYHSLYNNTTGYKNTANGYSALFLNTIGYRNTAYGNKSLFSNTIGNNNIALGDSSGLNISSGSYNVAIGNKVYVASGTSDNQLSLCNFIYGTGMDGYEDFISDGKIGIGTKSPNEILEVADKDNGHGRMIVSDGNDSDRFAILFVSPSSIDEAARIESYKYGSSSGGRTLEINTYGDGMTIFGGDVVPEAHKSEDLGSATKAWNDFYCDDVHNMGAAAFTDRTVTEELLNYPPQAKKPGDFDELTDKGLKELDPNSIPPDLRGGYDILTDEMTTYNYKANYEQQIIINSLLVEIDLLKKEIAEMKTMVE